jgi:hypothetical protein
MKPRIIIFLILLALNVNAQWYQKYYPGRDFNDLNRNELSVLYDKSDHLKKTGFNISLSGIIISGTGVSMATIALMIDFIPMIFGEGSIMPALVYDFSLGAIIIGAAMTVVGLPVWITGLTRNKKVSDRINYWVSDSSIALYPSLLNDKSNNKPAPGLTLTVRF